MKNLDFEQMEVISAGLTHNQTCLIGGAATVVGTVFGGAFVAAALLGALYYGCF